MDTFIKGLPILKKIEQAARICYKSEGKITEDGSSATKLIQHLIDSHHEAMLEHEYLSVKFIIDRALSHELVRHRMASFAQESQRYCNYSDDRFDSNVTFVLPSWLTQDDTDPAFRTWELACMDAEAAYFKLLEIGYLPQHARTVLPNCTKTELLITANIREWRHILKLRSAKDAHPDMTKLMQTLLKDLQMQVPVLFADIPVFIKEEPKA